MKITTENGQAMIDAHDLGKLLDLDPAQVPEKMRAGEITSVFETGQGEDAGRFRMTFFHAGKRVRLTCAEDGTVLSTIRTDTGLKP